MSIHADLKNIDCKGDLLKQVIPIVIDKLHKLVKVAGSVKKLCTTVKREDISCLPCSKSSSKSVKHWWLSQMGDKMRERDTTISYINLLKRENCQKLMLLLNQYWSSAAFENGKLDNQKIAEVTKGIREHSTTILIWCIIYSQFIDI